MHLLVVEDEPDLSAALRAGLTAEGYSVDTCTDGLAALQFVRRTSYAAVVLDLMLPHLSGYRVLETMRRERIDVPVLVLTARGGETDQIDALDVGADDLLGKPFSFPMLLARLRTLIRRATAAEDLIVTVGDLCVDRLRRRVWRGASRIELTDREFALLDELAASPAQPVGKGDLLRRLWPDVFAPDPNLVEARIAALRRKVDEPFGTRSIETVRGTGYRLVDARSHDGE